MYAARDIAAALYSSLVIGVLFIVGLIRPDTTGAVVTLSGCGVGIAGCEVGIDGRVGMDGRGGIAGRDDGVGFMPGIVFLDGASSRLKRRRWH